ncbi:MAG: NAD(+) kinase [Treponema sp. GWB1_62_6]|nr:MAG: NAD(+) kinase [Treponema sp. GWA1_62_8]OHE63358.1 MAG: NAD(+) kinase [Treponema sp. GWC1_61_84]OHE67267.1 MAG: NAD(+) kinase [Treponema sp. GWB1_62_6]OHE72981.1 MAG: NAD(+) kinase [Treponema sp. RIFOXYC1_FULL_61_9]HCM25299.1 NAD(+) kinase [Treponema sp.]
MPKKSARILLVVNLHKDDSRELMRGIVRDLGEEGYFVDTFAFEGKPESSPGGDYDIVFSLGGDGTVLFAARELSGRGIPILPINLGTLGFIASVHRDGWRRSFNAWIDGSASVSSRLMLDVRVERAGCQIYSFSCLNDAVVSASGISKIIRLDATMDSIRLGRYRADGLILATPTGSTAYSVAAGGPILDPEMEAIILNPVCPFTLSNRPIVIPATGDLRIDVEAEQRSAVILTIDGQIVVPLEPGDALNVRKAPKKAMLVASDRGEFFTALRSKLNWSGGPDA